MAIKRFSDGSSIKNTFKLSRGATSVAKPTEPTIGTVTVSLTNASVPYTASPLGGTAVSFTATSNPGSLTGTGSSPITVSGLTALTSYTFTVKATNANGDSLSSAVSNEITAEAPLSDYQSIQTYSLATGGTGSVTFNSGGVFANYRHLQVRWIAKCSRSAPNATMLMTLNGVAGGSGNYVGEQVEWDGTGPFYPSSGSFSANTGLAGNTYANYYSIGYANIYNINSTSVNKPFYASGVFQQGGTASGQNNWTTTAGSLIANTNAITSITLAPDIGTFNANTKIALYGLK